MRYVETADALPPVGMVTNWLSVVGLMTTNAFGKLAQPNMVTEVIRRAGVDHLAHGVAGVGCVGGRKQGNPSIRYLPVLRLRTPALLTPHSSHQSGVCPFVDLHISIGEQSRTERKPLVW